MYVHILLQIMELDKATNVENINICSHFRQIIEVDKAT